MKLAILTCLFVIATNYGTQAAHAWNGDYCSVVDYSFSTLGFKFGCLLKGELKSEGQGE